MAEAAKLLVSGEARSAVQLDIVSEAAQSIINGEPAYLVTGPGVLPKLLLADNPMHVASGWAWLWGKLLPHERRRVNVPEISSWGIKAYRQHPIPGHLLFLPQEHWCPSVKDIQAMATAWGHPLNVEWQIEDGGHGSWPGRDWNITDEDQPGALSQMKGSRRMSVEDFLVDLLYHRVCDLPVREGVFKLRGSFYGSGSLKAEVMAKRVVVNASPDTEKLPEWGQAIGLHDFVTARG
jgi:hypothetical protein